MDKLTAAQALNMAAELLNRGLDLVTEATAAGKRVPNDDVMAVAQVAQAYSAYALAYTLQRLHVDVRGSGI